MMKKMPWVRAVMAPITQAKRQAVRMASARPIDASQPSRTVAEAKA